MSHNLFSPLFVNSFSMFRVSSEAKLLEVELPGSLALSISEVVKALPAAPHGLFALLHQCWGCLPCGTHGRLWWLNDWRHIESLAGDTGKGEMGSLDMSEPSVGLILYTHSTQSQKRWKTIEEETEAERPSLVSICEWARAPVRLEIMGPVLSGWTDHSSSEEGYYGLEPEHPSQAIDSGLGVSMEQGSHWRVASVQGRACVGQSFRVKLGTLKTLEHCCPDDLPCPRQSYAKLCD